MRFLFAATRLARDILNIARTNGLDVERELGLAGKREFIATGETSLGVQDFLFLMDFLTAKQKSDERNDPRPIRTSIVICVYNHVDYTFKCLRSLLPQVDPHETEFIVINNGSSDDTSRLLSLMASAIKVVNNVENVGFVEACNQGAALAQGQYLVFLNNDTVVHPRWLHYLTETVEADDSVGAVGSMLLYPDGRLQEAGGIVWRDGNAANYGRGADPQAHEFSFAREVDYCSAAALLVRKDLFTRLGGFDENYSPAYYEDTDLCLGIRSLNFKVVYQPLARVTHWEGTTAGTDLENGFKRYQTINRTKFAQKWKGVLEKEHHENQPGALEKAADRRPGPRVIVFDNGVPTPDRDSGSQRMFMVLKALSRLGRPLFIPVNQPAVCEYQESLQKMGIEVVPRLEYKRFVAGKDYRVAILSRASVADEVFSSIRRTNRNIKIIFDTVDVHSLRLQREYTMTGDERLVEEADFRRRQESKLIRESDQIWCVTEADKAVFEKEVSATKIKVIPNIHIPQRRQGTFAEREGLLFIGNFLHRPNRDSLDYLIDSILPQLCRAIPRLKLYVVGSHMTEDILAYASDNIVILGYVPNVDHLFNQARLLVAPLRFGSGMKGKIGQALALGLPVVTTTIGAEGFGFSDGVEVMLGDDPVGFARAVIKAYGDQTLWHRLSDNGYRYVEENLSPAVVNPRIAAAIAELSNN